MTTGAYRNRLGEQRITTALLTRGTDNAARRAAAQWALGSKAKYALAANYGQFTLSGKAAALYYGHPSFWGYHIRFNGLGEQRIANTLFMRGSTDATRKAAAQWTFGKLRQLSVSANVGAYLLTGNAVTLTYNAGALPITLTATAIASAEAFGLGALSGGLVAANVVSEGGAVWHGSGYPPHEAPQPLVLPARRRQLFATGIASAEAFGAGLVVALEPHPQAVIGKGIASGECFGVHQMRRRPSARQRQDEFDLLFDQAA